MNQIVGYITKGLIFLVIAVPFPLTSNCQSPTQDSINTKMLQLLCQRVSLSVRHLVTEEGYLDCLYGIFDLDPKDPGSKEIFSKQWEKNKHHLICFSGDLNWETGDYIHPHLLNYALDEINFPFIYLFFREFNVDCNVWSLSPDNLKNETPLDGALRRYKDAIKEENTELVELYIYVSNFLRETGIEKCEDIPDCNSKNSYTKEVKDLVRKYSQIDVDSVSHIDFPPLHLAASLNLPKLIIDLIQTGIDKHSTNQWDYTAVFPAAASDALESLILLDSLGLPLVYPEITRTKPIYLSASSGGTQALDFFLSRKIGWIAENKIDPDLLMYAARSQNAEAIKLLESLGIDIFYTDEKGNIATFYAIQEKAGKTRNLEALKYLLESGLDPYHKNFDSLSILDITSYKGHLSAIIYLLENFEYSKESLQSGYAQWRRWKSENLYSVMGVEVYSGNEAEALVGKVDHLYEDVINGR